MSGESRQVPIDDKMARDLADKVLRVVPKCKARGQATVITKAEKDRRAQAHQA